MVEDARYRTKDYLEGITNPDTALNPDNLTKDDGTKATYMVAYGNPDYPIVRVFKTKGVDLIFSIGEPRSKGLPNFDHKAYGYEELVPILTFCIDKIGITGTKLKQKARAELRRITENYPTGSLRGLEWEGDNDQNLGGIPLYSDRFVLNYRRDTT